MFDLITLGEVMAELRRGAPPDSEWKVSFAGDTFNSAVYCRRAIPEAHIGFMSRIGQDPLSGEFLDFARKEFIDTSCVTIDQERSIGLYSVTTEASGERSFHYWRSSSAARNLFSEPEPRELPAARIILFSAITLAILSPSARQGLFNRLMAMREAYGSLIAFDSNYRPRLWESNSVARQMVSTAWDMADIALPSLDDELALFGEADQAAVLSRFARKNWYAGALKRAHLGPLSLGEETKGGLIFPPAERVVDTTAAGDSFNGAYLAGLLRGEPESQRLLAAHKCAREVVGFPGAIVPSSFS